MIDKLEDHARRVSEDSSQSIDCTPLRLLVETIYNLY